MSRVCVCAAGVVVIVRRAARCAVCCVLCVLCVLCVVVVVTTSSLMMMRMLGCAVVVVVVIIPSYIVIFLQAPGNQSSLRLGSNIRGSSEKNSILPKKETSQGFEAEVVKELPECVTNTQHSRLYTEG